MTHKRTPGPWRYEHEPGYCGELIAPDGMTIAAFADEPRPDDAKLIAAAPDLLAALLWAIEHAEAYVLQQLSDGAVGMREDLDARDRARAAIAKATK